MIEIKKYEDWESFQKDAEKINRFKILKPNFRIFTGKGFDGFKGIAKFDHLNRFHFDGKKIDTEETRFWYEIFWTIPPQNAFHGTDSEILSDLKTFQRDLTEDLMRFRDEIYRKENQCR